MQQRVLIFCFVLKFNEEYIKGRELSTDFCEFARCSSEVFIEPARHVPGGKKIANSKVEGHGEWYIGHG